MAVSKMQLYKSALLVWGLFFLTTLIPSMARSDQAFLVAENLQHEGRLAMERGLPVLLVFSATDCPYCELLEEDFLDPMSYNSEYDNLILFRKLILDNGSRVTDFSGNLIDATALADQYQITVTPTIVFIDGRGQELAERMVGINTVEMFGGYLDDCIETAFQQLRSMHGHAASVRKTGCSLQSK